MLTKTTQGWDRELFSWHRLRELIGNTVLEASPRDNDTLEDLNKWTVAKYVTILYIVLYNSLCRLHPLYLLIRFPFLYD